MNTLLIVIFKSFVKTRSQININVRFDSWNIHICSALGTVGPWIQRLTPYADSSYWLLRLFLCWSHSHAGCLPVSGRMVSGSPKLQIYTAIQQKRETICLLISICQIYLKLFLVELLRSHASTCIHVIQGKDNT